MSEQTCRCGCRPGYGHQCEECARHRANAREWMNQYEAERIDPASPMSRGYGPPPFRAATEER